MNINITCTIYILHVYIHIHVYIYIYKMHISNRWQSIETWPFPFYVFETSGKPRKTAWCKYVSKKFTQIFGTKAPNLPSPTFRWSLRGIGLSEGMMRHVMKCHHEVPDGSNFHVDVFFEGCWSTSLVLPRRVSSIYQSLPRF